jgi:uncharacterized protein YjiS (DUF1127 family)
MTSTSLPRPIPLHRPPLLRIFEIAVERLTALHRRRQARRAVRAEWRRSAEAERALARLSPETLSDIGAPQGLIGQRRWQDEQEGRQILRILQLHGW